MKTFAQLKRDLQKGKTLTMTFNRLSKDSETIKNRLNVPRYIIKTQTNGITLGENKDSLKGSFLELPRASLVEYKDNLIIVYEKGIRQLTKEEKNIIDKMPSNQKENEEMCRQDVMTDMNRTYWMDKEHTKKNNADWYWNEARGMYYNRGEQTMRDSNIKGEKSIVYKLN